MVTNTQAMRETSARPASSREVQKRAARLATEHILEAIGNESYHPTECAYYTPCETEEDKAKFLYGRFMSEYGWRVKQAGEQKALIDWLQGLALNIAFYNHDILRLAKEWGSLPDNATERDEDKILDNYWSYMAMQIIKLWNKHKVKP